MNNITVEKIHDIHRVTIPRSCFPDQNVALIITIVGSLTSANVPVINTDEYLMFNFDGRIPQSILYDFFQRWGINIEGMTKI